jgi:hypothetical protein
VFSHPGISEAITSLLVDQTTTTNSVDLVVTQAYIQKINGLFNSINEYSAWVGLESLGVPCEFFEYQQLESIPLSVETLVVGGIQTVRRAISLLGGITPPNIDYPDEITPLLGRHIHEGRLGDVRASVDTEGYRPVFVKPIAQKYFTGRVIAKFRDIIPLAKYPADTPVWVSEIVDFKSEYRVFVRGKEVQSVRPYKGDPLLFPNPETIKQAVTSLRLKTYCLDVGVNQQGQTLVVEVNDAFAFGTYGLKTEVHAHMLLSRWGELTRGRDQ